MLLNRIVLQLTLCFCIHISKEVFDNGILWYDLHQMISKAVWSVLGSHGFSGEKFASGTAHWQVPVLVNTGAFLMYQNYWKMWYLYFLESACVIQQQTRLKFQNGQVLSTLLVYQYLGLTVHPQWTNKSPHSLNIFDYRIFLSCR